MDKDVFISHSSRDRLIAEEVRTALESKNIRCWIAPKDVIPGKELTSLSVYTFGRII
ncbi:toll/interleukin-1 receptor domain-containing protein [Chloroflexota bacterium]